MCSLSTHRVTTSAVATFVLVQLVRGVVLTIDVHTGALPRASRVNVRVAVVMVTHRPKLTIDEDEDKGDDGSKERGKAGSGSLEQWRQDS